MGEASKKGLLNNISSDIRNTKLTKCSIVYKGQYIAGDELDISVWEDGDEALNDDEFLTHIKVEIEKDGKTMCTANLTFMQNQIISHL